MSLEATDIERRLRANRDAFVLEQHVSGKSEAWKNFSYFGHLGVSAGQCASCNNKAFLPVMDSHWVGSGRVTIFVGRVGSDLEIWTLVQLCNTVNVIVVLLGRTACTQ